MATSNPFAQLDGIADRLIANVPFFKGLNKAELFAFLGKAGRANCKPGEAVFREGDTGGNSLYVVIAGRVEVRKKLNDGTEDVVDTLGVGSCFGEMALIDNQPRSATVVAKEPTVTLSCTAETLAEFHGVALKFYENLARIIADRHLQTDRQLKTHLKPICQDTCVAEITKGMPTVTPEISARSLGRLAEIGQPYDVAARSHVVRENALGDNMYIVLDGTLEVRKTVGKDYGVLAMLKCGNYFGETALVCDDHGRSADVVAVTDARLVRLNAAHLQKSPEIGALVYRELAKIFSVRLRRSTNVMMHTLGRSCQRDCELLQQF